ncbi:MAG: PKD domain-containing protein, partial [Candidatus Paceibacterota bacterium]
TLGDDEPFDGSHSFDNDGEIVSYYWNFGDGSTTTKNVATTTHAYTATSTFTVQLIVTDNEGATSTPDTVTVTIAPQCFDGKDNDGDHKIDYPTDPGCRWYDDNDERDVNARPIADAGPDKIVTLGDAVTLDGSGSTDDKKIVSYEWNFGDGSTTTSAIATTTRTYTATSTYTVTLTVTDDEGVISDPDTAVITVATQCSDGKDNDGDGKIDYPTDPGCDSPDDNDEADNKLPIAVLSASPTSDLPNKPISLNGTGSHDPDGTIALYEWNFGDGVIATTTTASTTSHTYGTPNTYTVTLVVTDNEGATSTPATQTITITTPPTGCVSNCGGGGGGGGGGSVIQPSLQITNEVVEKGPVSGTALVKWQTNLPADSRVAYGTSSVTVFPIGDSKYGYQIDTTTLSNLITSHTMAIFGLNPNLTYYFRPLSKTSTLSAIGKELTLAPSECYYLREFIKYGANNNPIEVKKLQVFLNEFEGAKLDVTGFYDLASWNAVTLFQNKYKTNVLDPWGNTPLGYVYLTTRKQVNEIYCRAAFPLDANQTTEVNAYRALMESLRAQGIVSPEGTVLGASDNTSTEIASVSSEQADIGTTTAAKTETGKTPSVTNRGAFTNMLGSAYGSVAGTVSSNWLSLLLLLILIPTGVYAVKLYREEEPISKIFDEGKEEPADDDLGFGTMEEEYPDDII